MIGKIQGTGAYVPPKILENQQLEKWVETNDTWIRERTGVQRRHVVAKPEESTAFLATQAARQALKEARIKPEELRSDSGFYGIRRSDDAGNGLPGAERTGSCSGGSL